MKDYPQPQGASEAGVFSAEYRVVMLGGPGVGICGQLVIKTCQGRETTWPFVTIQLLESAMSFNLGHQAAPLAQFLLTRGSERKSYFKCGLGLNMGWVKI